MKALNKFIALFLVLALSIISGVVIYIKEIEAASANISDNKVIILDAGHGGFDGGAVAIDGTVEKDINLKISLALGDFLKQSGFSVVYSRESDTGTEDNSQESISTRKKSDLTNRLALMSKYPDAVFVSIHLNKFTTAAASGAQIFYSKNREESALLGDSIQKNIVNMLQKENSRVIKQGNSSTYILNNATVPTVIVECGFLSNPNDLLLLKQPDYQKSMAFCIYCGILDFYKK